MYHLNKQVGEGVERTDDFREDPDIPEQYRTKLSDYDEPIYDMGHLANSESVDGSVAANSETFYLSNMTPQLPGHNRAIWRGLENRERKWADQRDLVVVITGPIYKQPIKTIGISRVPVPSQYFKIIYDPAKHEVISYLLPHQKDKTANLKNYYVSVDEIERLTGFDFLNLVSDQITNSIEPVTPTRSW